MSKRNDHKIDDQKDDAESCNKQLIGDTKSSNTAYSWKVNEKRPENTINNFIYIWISKQQNNYQHKHLPAAFDEPWI